MSSNRIIDPSSFGSVRCSASSISAKPQRRSPASNSCIGSGRVSSNSVDWAPRATRLPRFGMRFSLRDPTQLSGACLARPQNVCTTTAEARTTRMKNKIARLRHQMQDLQAMKEKVQDAPDQQISLTDPDARSMATSGRGTGIVGYNVQTAVDAEHHLIVAHEVINVGHDRAQLEPMARKEHDAMGCDELTALADRGYFNGEQVLACERTGISPCVPKTVWPHERGLFTHHDFICDAENNHYTCSAGQKLTKGLVRSDRRDDIDHYRHLTACFTL